MPVEEFNTGPGSKPSRAVYGFVMYLGSWTVLGLYLFWAFVPEVLLHAMGITYYPQKYWCIAIPVYVLVCVVSMILGYNFINLMITPNLNATNNIEDDITQYQSSPEENLSAEAIRGGSLPPLRDIPIGRVCRLLYMEDQTK